MCLLWAALGLGCCSGFVLWVAASRGYSFVVVGWLLLVAASLVAEHPIQGKRASVVATPGL